MDFPLLVMFDLGGTLLRDTGVVPQALSAALQAKGFAASSDEIGRARGASKFEAIRQLVASHLEPGDPQADEAAQTVFQDFVARMKAGYGGGGAQAMPGAEATFSWLRGRGIPIAFNTGFDRAITRLALEAVGWSTGVAAAIVCGDDVTQGRPAPYMIFHAMEIAGVTDVRRVAVVGDTVLDLQAGANAGAGWNIGVLSGAHSRQQLEKEPHTALLPGVGDLESLWSVSA